jgi:hypothetical protein
VGEMREVSRSTLDTAGIDLQWGRIWFLRGKVVGCSWDWVVSVHCLEDRNRIEVEFGFG